MNLLEQILRSKKEKSKADNRKRAFIQGMHYGFRAKKLEKDVHTLFTAKYNSISDHLRNVIGAAPTVNLTSQEDMREVLENYSKLKALYEAD